MNTKLVYVVTSGATDLYLEQALLSVYSARSHNPNAEIILLTDDKTNATLQGKRAGILSYITEKIVVELSEHYTPMQRSRILKITARQHVNGDFLYVDSDTIITGQLLDVDNFTCNVGAVKDAHGMLENAPWILGHLKKIARKMEWPDLLSSNIFNGGLLYVKDNEATRKFYEDWHRYWLESYQKGISIDQPALAMANNANNHIICELPGVWNCQLRYGLRYFPNAKIIHFCATDIPSQADQPLFELMSKNTYKRIKQSGAVEPEVAEMLTHPIDFIAEQTDILANKDVLIWNSETGLFVRRMYSSFPRIFQCFNFISRCLLYFDNHIFKIFKK